jgi:hypothetical protein
VISGHNRTGTVQFHIGTIKGGITVINIRITLSLTKSVSTACYFYANVGIAYLY